MQLFEILADALWKFLEQMEALKNFKTFLRRRVIGQCGRRGDRGQIFERHVGQQQRQLLSLGRGHGEASTLYSGEVFAHGVDFRDGRPGGNERLVKGNGVIERDSRVERQVEHGRSASADKEENESVLACPPEQFQSLTRSLQRILVRQRMAAFEIAYSPGAFLRDLRRRAHAAKR